MKGSTVILRHVSPDVWKSVKSISGRMGSPVYYCANKALQEYVERRTSPFHHVLTITQSKGSIRLTAIM